MMRKDTGQWEGQRGRESEYASVKYDACRQCFVGSVSGIIECKTTFNTLTTGIFIFDRELRYLFVLHISTDISYICHRFQPLFVSSQVTNYN